MTAAVEVMARGWLLGLEQNTRVETEILMTQPIPAAGVATRDFGMPAGAMLVRSAPWPGGGLPNLIPASGWGMNRWAINQPKARALASPFFINNGIRAASLRTLPIAARIGTFPC